MTPGAVRPERRARPTGPRAVGSIAVPRLRVRTARGTIAVGPFPARGSRRAPGPAGSDAVAYRDDLAGGECDRGRGRERPVCSRHDPAAVAAAIERLLGDSGLRERMCASNRAKVREFAPSVAARRYIDALEEIDGALGPREDLATAAPWTAERACFDVVFYTPWIGSILSRVESMPPGGAETQVLMLARALTAQGARVAIVVFGHPSDLPRMIDGVTIVTRPPYRRPTGALARIAEAVRIWRALWRCLHGLSSSEAAASSSRWSPCSRS